MAMKFFQLKILCSALMILQSLIFFGCSEQNINFENLPTPPNSQKGIKYPEFQTQILLSSNPIIAELKKTSNKVDSKFITFENPTDWKTVVEFYDSQLKAKDFERKSEIPQNKTSIDSAIYESSRIFTTNQKIILTLIEIKDSRTETKYDFLHLAYGS